MDISRSYPTEVSGKPILAEKVAWLLFGVTSLQLAFLHPYIVLLPGEHINLFSGLLCALSLGATVWAANQAELRRRRLELAICLVLAGLVLLSGFYSSLPWSNTWRGLVFLSSALGGFWGARILLTTAARQRSFTWLGLFMLSGILLVTLISYCFTGKVIGVLDTNAHPLATKVLLLWFAPLALVWSRPRWLIPAAVLLGLSYLIFFVAELRSAMLFPLILAVLAAFYGGLRIKYLLIMLAVAGIILFYFIRLLPPEKIGKQYEPAYYRLENYSFCWHIAVKHPLLGIGFLTPREKYLQDYQVKYPYVTQQQFAGSLNYIVVADNMILTFMAGVGFPFVLLYSFSIIVLLRRLTRTLRVNPLAPPIAPLAVFLPLVAGLFSFFVFDLLLHPQVCWFFHVLLGLIPMTREGQSG